MTVAELINADCRDVISNVIVKYSNSIIVSDPPFNVGYHYNKYKDKMDEDEYYKMLANIFSIRPSVVVHYPEALHRLSHRMNDMPKRIVSWVYNSNTERQHRDIAFYGIYPDFSQCRQPYKNMKDPRCIKLYEKTGGAKLYDWIYCDQVKNKSPQKLDHPCQMPLELMIKVLKILPNDSVIIDPFCGTGTTLVAAKALNRNYVGIEIDKKYFDIASKRLGEMLI